VTIILQMENRMTVKLAGCTLNSVYSLQWDINWMKLAQI